MAVGAFNSGVGRSEVDGGMILILATGNVSPPPNTACLANPAAVEVMCGGLLGDTEAANVYAEAWSALRKRLTESEAKMDGRLDALKVGSTTTLTFR
jgi:hypothetical protein